MNPKARTFNPKASSFTPSPPPTPTPVSWEEADQPKPAIQVVPKPSSDSPKQESKNTEKTIVENLEKMNVNDVEDEEMELPGTAEEADSRDHLNIVFIGHVDAGKSTMSGNILLLTGQVDERTIQKYEREAKEKNRESWYLAFIMDTNEEERAKGKTVEVGRAPFDTPIRRYTILDAPGHKNYVPNMIGAAAQADIGVLVISARKGEFETGFDRGGQTREHTRLAKIVGIRNLIVVVNKMDDPTVNWSKQRYDECVEGLTPFLRETGFNIKKDVVFLPVSGFSGANIKEPLDPKLAPWYKGPPLLGVLDTTAVAPREPSAPVRVPIFDRYKDRGCTVVMGKLESGSLQIGQKLILMPNKDQVEVVYLANDQKELKSALPGENLKIGLKGVEEDNVREGHLLCSDDHPVPCVEVFDAQLVILELRDSAPVFTAGFEAVIHIHTAIQECSVVALIATVDIKTGQIAQKRPRYVTVGAVVRVRIKLEKPLPVERFADFPQLGRFSLRDCGKTVAFGKVLSAGEKKKE